MGERDNAGSVIKKENREEKRFNHGGFGELANSHKSVDQSNQSKENQFEQWLVDGEGSTILASFHLQT